MAHHLFTIAFENVKKRKGFIKFLGVGSVNTVVDLILFFILANLFSIYAPVASIISTGLTLILSFYLNHKFVFQSQKKKRATAIYFVLITLFNVWVVQSSIIWVIVHGLENTEYFNSHLWTLNLLAKIAGVSVSFILNFIGYRYIFTKGVLNDSEEKN